MHTRHTYPRPVREIENMWIPLPDARLAARVWLPEDAESDPVPALLEYLPYRKSDGTTWRDALRAPYYAGHGYAVLRVDMRGSLGCVEQDEGFVCGRIFQVGRVVKHQVGSSMFIS